MLQYLWVALAFYSLFWSQFVCSTHLKAELADNESFNATLAPYMCDDVLVHRIERRLDHLVVTYDAMRSKLDLFKSKLEQQAAANNLLLSTEFQKLKVNLERYPKRSPGDRGTSAGCTEALLVSGASGIYKIQPDPLAEAFYVYCELDEKGGDAWTIMQRRRDGSQEFYRSWSEYRQGFGNLAGEFFLGLDKMHLLTERTLQELWINMEDFANTSCNAHYAFFAIGDERQAYALKILGNFTGECGDSLGYHQGMKFTTKDAHNDANRENCAQKNRGAWWYNKCQSSNLNGQYFERGHYPAEKYGWGIDWSTWHGHNNSLKAVQMAVRAVKSNV